jgi:hypothetical protein
MLSRDVLATQDVINHLALSVDARDWESARDCLTDTVEFAPTPAHPATTVPATAFLEQLRTNVETFDATQHAVTNHVVAPTADGLECTTSFRYEHLRDGRDWTFGGRQSYRLTRGDGRWRIASIAMLATWQHGDLSPRPNETRPR